MPQLATIASQILQELNAFSLKNRKPDQFTERRLLKEIDKLKQADYAAALLCEAILATLHQDYPSTKQKFEEILNMDENDASSHENYANSLHRLGRLNEALHHFMRALTLSRTSASLLHDIASAAHATLRPDIFREALDIYSKATGNSEVLESEIISSGITLADNFEKFDIPPEEANKLYISAERVIRRHDSSIDIGSYHVTEGLGGPDLCFYAGVDADAEKLHEMNMDLCEEIVEIGAQAMLSKIALAFVPREGLPVEGHQF